MFDKPLDAITIEDIRALVRDKEPEGQTLDYKQELPSTAERDTGRFLDDVNAFANASGGDIVFGIPEERDEQGRNTGRPMSATGLPGTINLDAERLRLVSMIRSNVEPRLIPGWTVVDGDDGPIIVVRIYAGWSGPYRLRHGEQSRFFVRTGSGKHAMDMTEIRTEFVRSATLEQRVRQFRDDRLARIITGDTPVALGEAPKLVLHLFPLSAAGLGEGIDVRRITRDSLDFYALGSTGGNPRYDIARYNIDGWMIPAWREHMTSERPQRIGYTQVFRDGAVETVNTSLLIDEGAGLIWVDNVAYTLVDRIERYRVSLKALGVSPPIFCMVSIVRANGRQIYMPGPQPRGGGGGGKLDRDMVLLPEVVFADEETPTAEALRPMFDALWQAGNYPECTFYDGQGEWIPRP